jgi:hypothetical protein
MGHLVVASWPPSLAASTFVLALVTVVGVAATFLLAWYGRKDVAAQERPVLLADERRIEFHQENLGESEERQIALGSTSDDPRLSAETRLRLPTRAATN